MGLCPRRIIYLVLKPMRLSCSITSWEQQPSRKGPTYSSTVRGFILVRVSLADVAPDIAQKLPLYTSSYVAVLFQGRLLLFNAGTGREFTIVPRGRSCVESCVLVLMM